MTSPPPNSSINSSSRSRRSRSSGGRRGRALALALIALSGHPTTSSAFLTPSCSSRASPSRTRLSALLSPDDLAALQGNLFPSGTDGLLGPKGKGSGMPGESKIYIGAKIDVGHPEEIVGIWQIYNALTSSAPGLGNDQEKEVSDRLVLRADGQVVGGPSVDNYFNSWSDPDGLKARGGKWEIWRDEQDRPRLALSLAMERNSAGDTSRELLLDGKVVLVREHNPYEGKMELIARSFGRVTETHQDTDSGKDRDYQVGSFSMFKLNTKGKEFIASVGSPTIRPDTQRDGDQGPKPYQGVF